MIREFERALAGDGNGRIIVSNKLMFVRLGGVDGPIQIAHNPSGTTYAEGDPLLIAPTKAVAPAGWWVLGSKCLPMLPNQQLLTTAFDQAGTWEYRDSSTLTVGSPMPGQVNGFEVDNIGAGLNAALATWFPSRVTFSPQTGRGYVADGRTANGGYLAHDYLYQWDVETNVASPFVGIRQPGGSSGVDAFCGQQDANVGSFFFGSLGVHSLSCGGPDNVLVMGLGEEHGAAVAVVYLNDAAPTVRLIAGARSPGNYPSPSFAGSPLAFLINPSFWPPYGFSPVPYYSEDQPINWPSNTIYYGGHRVAIHPTNGEVYVQSGINGGFDNSYQIGRITLNSLGRLGQGVGSTDRSVLYPVVGVYDIYGNPGTLPPNLPATTRSSSAAPIVFSPDGTLLYFAYGGGVWSYHLGTKAVTRIAGRDDGSPQYPGPTPSYLHPTRTCWGAFEYELLITDMTVAPNGTIYLHHGSPSGAILALRNGQVSVVARELSPATLNPDYQTLTGVNGSTTTYRTWPRPSSQARLSQHFDSSPSAIECHPITGTLYARVGLGSTWANIVPPAFPSQPALGATVVGTRSHLTRFGGS